MNLWKLLLWKLLVSISLSGLRGAVVAHASEVPEVRDQVHAFTDQDLFFAELEQAQGPDNESVFEAASLLFDNFFFVRNPENILPLSNSHAEVIYLLGTSGCSRCRALAGGLLKKLGRLKGAPKSSKTMVEIDYFELDLDHSIFVEPSQFPIARRLKLAPSDFENMKAPIPFVQDHRQFLQGPAAFQRLRDLQLIQQPPLISQDFEHVFEHADLISKVAGLFMFATHIVSMASDQNLVRRYQPAGIVIYRMQHNSMGMDLTTDFIRTGVDGLQRLSRNRLWVAVDQEGGSVQRLRSTQSCILPSANRLLGVSDEAIRRFGKLLNGDLLKAGVNVNLAPVVDLMNPENEDITGWGRAISDDALKVSHIASLLVSESLNSGILPFLKHFPGLGRTINTHEQEPQTFSESYEDLFSKSPEANDLLPFQRLFSNPETSPIGVVIGHVRMSAYDSKNILPFSERTIDELLRRKMGIDGLVMNDGFSMVAARSAWVETGHQGPAAFAALEAGVAPLFIDGDKFESALLYVVDRIEGERDPLRKAALLKKVVAGRERLQRAQDRLLSLERARWRNDPSTRKIFDNSRLVPRCRPEDQEFLNSL